MTKKQSEEQPKNIVQTVVTRVLQRELEAKQKSFAALETEIIETEQSLEHMRERRKEVAKDINVLEQSLEDLAK